MWEEAWVIRCPWPALNPSHHRIHNPGPRT